MCCACASPSRLLCVCIHNIHNIIHNTFTLWCVVLTFTPCARAAPLFICIYLVRVWPRIYTQSTNEARARSPDSFFLPRPNSNGPPRAALIIPEHFVRVRVCECVCDGQDRRTWPGCNVRAAAAAHTGKYTHNLLCVCVRICLWGSGLR